MSSPRGDRLARLDPRGLSRTEAAAYVGISATLFGELVEAGIFPAPKRLKTRCVWDRIALDRAFDELPEGTQQSNIGSGDDWTDARA